jgi:hypothetical protein
MRQQGGVGCNKRLYAYFLVDHPARLRLRTNGGVLCCPRRRRACLPLDRGDWMHRNQSRVPGAVAPQVRKPRRSQSQQIYLYSKNSMVSLVQRH